MGVLTVGAILAGIHAYKKLKGKLAEYDYRSASLRGVMSMLVHGCYFRDLNVFGDVAATFLGYQNPRAENYSDRHYEPLPLSLQPSWRDRSEAKELGLQFLIRKDQYPNSNSPAAPRLAIVLRGTIPYRVNDLGSDIKIAVEKLHKSEAVARTRELILEVLEKFHHDAQYVGERICMAGHSLGAAIALQVGKSLFCKHRFYIDTHLFNPPMLTVRDIVTLEAFGSLDGPASWSRYEYRYSGEWSKMLRRDRALADDWVGFQNLVGWVPHFYLNPGDPICRLFIKYFKSSTPGQHNPPQEFFAHFFSQNAKLIPNVVPFAHVQISYKYSRNFVKAHSLRQWHKLEDPFRLEVTEDIEDFHVNLLACRPPMASGRAYGEAAY